MKIELVNSADEVKLREWDEFQMSSPRGHYCALSTWLASFRPYGFDYGVVLARDQDGKVRGGAGFATFNKMGFRVLTIPIGPTVDESAEEHADSILSCAYEHAKNLGVTLFQATIPYASDRHNSALLASFSTQLPLRDGQEFGTAYAPAQMLWIEFPRQVDQEQWADELLSRFKKHTRRDVKGSEREDLRCLQATSASELRDAFAVIENNGRALGYATREWADFGPTVITQVSRGHAMMLTAVHDGRVVGAHYSVFAGRRCSYVMGGTLRTGDKLRIGHFLHWNVMKRAHELGLTGYDLTSQGSTGVMNFKRGFSPEEIYFIAPKHAVLSAARYRAFKFLYPRLRKHRQVVARALRHFA